MATTMMPPQQPHVAIPDLSGSIETDDSRKSKSPSRFTNFFRWGSQSEQGGNVGPPEVRIDEHGNRASLAPSVAISPKSKYLPSAIDTSLANGRDGGLSPRTGVFSEVDMFPNSPTTVEAIEQEVRMVSADLAASIRREMDLENLIERLQAEAAARGDGETNTTIDQRRTSDYFSDIGTPVRIGSRDVEKMDAEKTVRRVEQEKAQMRLELLEQVQAEREKRRLAEHQARELEDLVNKVNIPPAQNQDGILSPQTSGIAPVSPDALPKILNLEKQLSEAKRRLSEERSMKENFQTLLSSLKAELDACQAERDNFKNEIVPELQSRVEGLETEAAENQKLSYDTTRLQQEIEKLKSENASLTASNKEKSDSLPDFKIAPLPKLQQLQTGGSAPKNRYSMSGPPTSFIPSTGRNSMIAPMSPMSGLAAKDRESLLERLKDVEAQRDALHKALKGLRDRQVYESKKARAKIASLETERERARNPSKQRSRDTEVSALRREVDRLRQRADDALDQKFVCERSLGTLKMDLEKAEQETTTLRALLQEHDDLLAQHDELRNSHQRLSKEISELKHGRSRSNSNPNQPSMSLQQAYKDLQLLHERSLQRLDQLEADGESPDDAAKLAAANAANAATIEKLRSSLSEAEAERDLALAESAGHRARADSLARAESQHMVEERSLAVQLRISSERCEELALQVRAQIDSNAALRDRLAECIQRGENEQKASAKKINELQNKLRQLEDRVVEAQQMAEDAVVAHEDEIRRIRETHTSQLKRLRASTLKVPSPGSRSPTTSPLLRTPNLEWTSVRKLSQADASKTEVLLKRIKDLERALGDADDEMSEVVHRMNAAQIEVLELQTERYVLLNEDTWGLMANGYGY
jgi:chromosome segregation ATPase